MNSSDLSMDNSYFSLTKLGMWFDEFYSLAMMNVPVGE